MKCDFSVKHYQEILEKALKDDFKIINFQKLKKAQKSSKIILLRHDIDCSPRRALEIAKIENNLKIKSTFFVRVHGEFYHPFDRITFPVLKEIIKMGHEIGLHTEARNLALEFKMNMIDLFKIEKKILETMLSIKIESASEHADFGRTKDYWTNHFFTKVKKEKVGIKNFPQEKRFQEFHYLSDSLGHWREGCLCQNFQKYQYIQALIHPDHWGKNACLELKKLRACNNLGNIL
ncbi:MAG: hypothetical protein US31_C0002G0099 [Berkelbacteria bacterium GW2011_GWA1_36_9]|uniref:Polysaccharide deacetylase n=1 Tax=Berkelbacteria bacterium GW2011_GWA1_36_9 TaxID=1618331 RepID=A0A0G0I3B8_9BACT|nr:MAG: hypothetical protein US31_C0002G0099 [Berkelbacteria bacterium GW2011_GWA1_36_9]